MDQALQPARIVASTEERLSQHLTSVAADELAFGAGLRVAIPAGIGLWAGAVFAVLRWFG